MAPHTSNKYKLYALAVHKIFTRNNSETSNAYTYIKYNIKKNYGKIDTKAFQARYHNQAIQDMYINNSNKILETFSYRNERSIKFEVFNSKFQNEVNILDIYSCTMHNKDVVDLLWKKMNNT